MTDDGFVALPPLHPGEILREDFMRPLGLSAGRIAKSCGVPRTRIERIASEQSGITGDTALRLGRFFGTTSEFWMKAQSSYEIEMARTAAGEEVERIGRYAA